jgi:hypothetical protein
MRVAVYARVTIRQFDLEAAHIYKIYGGKTHEIETMGYTLPPCSKNGRRQFIK